MKQKYKGIIFDLDGTLVDTIEDIAASMNFALSHRGFPLLPIDEYKDKVGWGIERLAFLALPDEERSKETVALIAKDAVGYYEENPLNFSRPYPGILQMLSSLKRNKLKMSVLTNKPDFTAQIVISKLFPPDTFDYVQGEISGNPLKPDPASVWEILVELNLIPSGIIFVGDSEIDMETAIASGCYALGASWGYRSREALERAGAKHIIDEPNELLNFFP
ncbi:MAG: HAD family hydrolase [Treponema sp.]|nr:HAD family hydrolase [Treponema sp.]